MTKHNIIKVVSATVTTTGATFYTVDGDVVPVSIDNLRVSQMVDQVVEAIRNNKTPIEVDISTSTVLNQIQEESGGFLKFFRVAKNKVKSILGSRAARGNVDGDGMVRTPRSDKIAPQPGTEAITPSVEAKLAEAEVKANGLTDEQTTIVAVVGDTPIVGAEALIPHAEAAVAVGDTTAFHKVMERLGGVAKERKHTVQEAMKFLQEMDLPFANDGCILAYKSLSKTSEEGIFVDNHTQKLKQGLGTLVQMDVEAVDDNRRVLCSNGLHVARRGYLSGYGTGYGNVITLIKIAPEDIISVPTYEASKMRVRAYHIVAVLNDEDRNKISNKESITKDAAEASSLLAKIIRGDHVPVLNITTQHKDGKIDQMVPVNEVKEPEIIGAVEVAHTVDVVKQEAEPLLLKPAEINKQLIEDQKNVEPEKVVKKPEGPTRQEQAMELFVNNKWNELANFKKQKKVSWEKLGFGNEEIKEIEKKLAKK